MDFKSLFQQYWPLAALLLWLGYKWWNAKRVKALLPALMQQGAILVDVRSAAEFAAGHAPGTVNIPLGEIGSRLNELPHSVPVVLCCASGTRSGMAKMMLKKHGHPQVFNIGKWRNLLD